MSGSNDKTVKIWELNTESIKFELNGHLLPVNGFAIIKNGYLVSNDEGGNLII